MQDSNESRSSSTQILDAYPGATYLVEDMVTVEQMGRPQRGVIATFEYEEMFAGRRQMVLSHLIMFTYVGGEWLLKYRITHLKEMDSSKSIESFLKELRWTIPDS